MARMTRREFLSTGVKLVALASVPAILPLNPERILAGPGKAGDLTAYLDLFGVDQDLLRKVMAVALEKGGDYCDLYFEHKISNWVGLEDDQVNRAYSTVDLGVGIRVIEGDQTGYSYTEELSREAMLKAARTASNIANQGATPGPVEVKFHKLPNYYPSEILWETVGIEQKIPFIMELNQKLKEKDSRVVKTRVWYGDEAKHILVANSEGQLVCDYQPMADLTAGCTAEEGGQRENCWYSFTARKGMEHFSTETMNKVADGAVTRTVTLLEAIQPEGGELEVVLGAGGSGILLHEAIGHGMEADFNRKNESIFSDMIGKQVAESIVTIVDDGTVPSARGSLNVDDEANATEKTVLVENGTLRSYMHDRISARHYGVEPTGNGRRESFRYMAIPRMRCTYMEPGPHKREEIIKSVKKGIYCESFTNGEVHIGPGDFTFYVKTGNLIEDGKLTRPIKDTNIIGNGPEVLRRVTMVGDDLAMSVGGGTCGKAGQGVPVSMGLPTVKVSAITVGGTTGNAGKA